MSEGRSPLLGSLWREAGGNPRVLLAPTGESPLLERQRTRLIIARARAVALLFAVLTPLWIVVDMLVMPGAVAADLAVTRMVASIAFAALAWGYPRREGRGAAWGALALLFVVPSGFFLFTHPYLSAHDLGGMEGAFATGYAFLPFVMIAGLSIFPLTLAEGAAFSSPVIGAQAAVMVLNLNGLPWTTHLGALWLLLLIATVATLAGMSQLQMMDRLIRHAAHDPLTGLLNRRSGEYLLARVDAQHRRRGTGLAVAFLDLDDFKSINDRYGHEAGDICLQQAAEALQSATRAGDMVIRWGGEEFVLVLPDTDDAGARAVAERIAGSGLGLRPDGRTQTASFGLACREATERDRDWRQLLEQADQRMYLAKGTGPRGIVGEGDVPTSSAAA